jgi:hypothetical protein
MQSSILKITNEKDVELISLDRIPPNIPETQLPGTPEVLRILHSQPLEQSAIALIDKIYNLARQIPVKLVLGM